MSTVSIPRERAPARAARTEGVTCAAQTPRTISTGFDNVCSGPANDSSGARCPASREHTDVARQRKRRQRPFADNDGMHELHGDVLRIAGLRALADHEQGRGAGETLRHAATAVRDGRRLGVEESHRRGGASRKVFMHD